MRKISEYEQRATECRKMAAKTRNPLHKQQLEDMARAWEMLLGVRWKQVETFALCAVGGVCMEPHSA